jgi:hypothetical protein
MSRERFWGLYVYETGEWQLANRAFAATGARARYRTYDEAKLHAWSFPNGVCSVPRPFYVVRKTKNYKGLEEAVRAEVKWLIAQQDMDGNLNLSWSAMHALRALQKALETLRC